MESDGEFAIVREIERPHFYMQFRSLNALTSPSVTVESGLCLEFREGEIPLVLLQERMKEISRLPVTLSATVPTFENRMFLDPTSGRQFLEGFGFETRQGPMLFSLIWSHESGGPNEEVQKWVRNLQDFLSQSCRCGEPTEGDTDTGDEE